MWTRQHPENHSDEEEQREREWLMSLLPQKETGVEPDPSYWQNLIVRTNRRIDDVSSAKAISISWVARVAIPGAVAILFFFIGLHYYAPERKPDQVSVSEIVSGLPDASQDSLVTHLLERAVIANSGTAFYDGVLEPSEDEMQQYLVSGGSTGVLLQTLPEDQVSELLSLLQGKNTNPLL
jgi:hypothetical protein